MMPRGAGSGTSRSRFSSDCSTYWAFWRTCVLKNCAISNPNAPKSRNVAERPRRATSFGWKLTGVTSGGGRLEQGPEQDEEEDAGEGGGGRRERGPDERLHHHLGAVQPA